MQADLEAVDNLPTPKVKTKAPKTKRQKKLRYEVVSELEDVAAPSDDASVASAFWADTCGSAFLGQQRLRQCICCGLIILIPVALWSQLPIASREDPTPPALPPSPTPPDAYEIFMSENWHNPAAASGMHVIEVTTLQPPPPSFPPPSPPPLPPPPPPPPSPSPPPPPSSPPPPPMPLVPLAEKMNSRLGNRTARVDSSGQRWEGGVLIHAMDELELDDRLVTLLLDERRPADVLLGASNLGQGGMVVNVDRVKALCAYGSASSLGGGERARRVANAKTCSPSGGSWVQPGADCIPGCLMVVPDGDEEAATQDGDHVAAIADAWCDSGQARDAWCDGQPWRPEEIETMIGLSDREGPVLTVFDGELFRSRQPQSVDAIFMVEGDPDGGEAARKLYRAFLSTFPEVRAAEFPLLIFRPDHPSEPFAEAPTEGSLSTKARPEPSIAEVPVLQAGAVLAIGTARVPPSGSLPPPPPPPPPPKGAATAPPQTMQAHDWHPEAVEPDECNPKHNNGAIIPLSCLGYGRL